MSSMNAVQNPTTGAVSFTFARTPRFASPASPMGLFEKLPAEMMKIVLGYLCPSARLKISRRWLRAGVDGHHIDVAHKGAWRAALKLSGTSKAMQQLYLAHKHDAQVANNLNLVVNMTDHALSPMRLVFTNKKQSPTLIKFLNTFTRLELSSVITLYTKKPRDALWGNPDDEEVPKPEYERVVSRVTLMVDLEMTRKVIQPHTGPLNNIISITAQTLYSNVSDTTAPAFTTALRGIAYALSHPLLAQSCCRLPYLETVNAKELFDLGILLTDRVRKLAVVPQRHDTTGIVISSQHHEVSMDWLGWIEDQEEEKKKEARAAEAKAVMLAKQVYDAIEAAKFGDEKDDGYTDDEE